ncbi:hypothetical protein FKZ61_010355 [Litorilinea aerophila]|uniref:Sucrase ferredoxin n=1 Tax=Litorilinea aerophila TaxID=1204385 RepID=A0A540VGF6_9CHLR|nr:sucrase ferredoxin [Litorilinea aerophila]MCC9076509.1 hypothetical protein [Litorilinea aerophila]OUC06594.1 hypothetical protein RY27_20070 [Litorilinea aerophila]
MATVTTTAPHLQDSTYCNVLARQNGLDPGGHAGHFDDAVLVETPLPWRRDIYQTAGPLPQELIDLLALWLERYRQTGIYNHRPLLIAPDPDYSEPGYRRVIFYRRPQEPCAHFHKTEYSVPEAKVGPLLWALFQDREGLAAFEPYRRPEAERLRDLLVCTHGTVDVACAKFGYPLYRNLRHEIASPDLRIWRVSHFGGHVFAPTFLDMPTGHYWAYMDVAESEAVLGRTGAPAALYGHYRGWAGLPTGFAQAVEREIWQQEGWQWFDYPKACTVLEQDTDGASPRWMVIRMDFRRTDGSSAGYLARVEISHTVETRPSTRGADAYAYPQYEVSWLKLVT